MLKQKSEGSKHEKFEIKLLQRSRIKNAPYNPRKIDSASRKKLKANLSRVGLLQPLVWNRKTGNLVAGHQRLEILDELEKRSDYKIHVAVVELSSKQEVEQNLFFNNLAAQGSWDEDKLASVFKTLDLTLDNTGFDKLDLDVLIQDPEVLKKFGVNQGEIEEEIEEVFNNKESVRDHLNSQKEKAAEKIREDPDENREFYVVVYFDSNEGRESFMKRINQDPNDRYVEGSVLLKKLKKV